MANGKGPKLDRKVVNKLLDKLSTDDKFRDLFQSDPHAALVEAGWTPPEDAQRTDDMATLSGGSCLSMTSGATLASKESIAAQRDSLESALTLPFQFACPAALMDR
jgi:putative modified peptide